MRDGYGILHQDPSNTHARGMSSAEASKYRMWDADPEYLVSPFEALQALHETVAERQRREERAAAHERALGYIAVPSMVAE